MIGIKEMLRYSLTKTRVVHSLPGRIRLKVPHLNRVPIQHRNHHSEILHAIRILNGIEDVTINYDLGTVLITYDTKVLYERKLLAWVDRVIQVNIDNVELFRRYGETNLQYVINTIEHQLKDIVKEYS
ncbi:HMA2 domain-containing protein [Clostridium cellulovorans]|uniref:Cation transporter n=1 Tax=Clostridium cellulovorans (strain ATCC 35296 / DSM 3052 / OCM 3 / 743B) TaxID=573061 RepID=D9SLG0_CLOC7|nr:cation transporter [Clostridium cellulovorans]ADL53597.1 hypothetical protein Clocel_3931 [Clostridium cellulovorans 743B]